MSFEDYLRRVAEEEMHPALAEHLSTLGVTHISNGRRLPVGKAAVLSMEEQEVKLARPALAKQHRIHEPVPEVVQGARAYSAGRGLPDPHAQSYADVRTHPDRIRAIGRAYQAMPDHDPAALPHYAAMGREINEQYKHLTGPMGIRHEVVEHDPYKNAGEMIHDLRHNKRIQTLSTASSGAHPYFSNEDNDKFRAVHDAFGHAATGRDFDAHGEEAAWMAHSKMFTPAARGALTSETRGQNSYYNTNVQFAPQKVALLPQHMWNRNDESPGHLGSIYPDLNMLLEFEAKKVGDMNEEELDAHYKQQAADSAEGKQWNDEHRVHADHVIAHWDQATDDEKEAGKNWYKDAHHLAKHVANDTGQSTHTVAGLLANYSPQTHWATNMHTAARVARDGKGLGGEGSGVFASDNQRHAADRLLAGEDHDSVLAGPKTRAFAHLIEHGTNEDDTDPKGVCVDRHALSVAGGGRASDAAYLKSGLKGKKRYQEVADTYHEAARQISARTGQKVHGHQVQAATWLVRQRLNEQEDRELSKTASSKNAEVAKAAIKTWNKYAGEHHPDLMGKEPGTGYSADTPEDVQHVQDMHDEGRHVVKAASLSVYPNLFKVAHDSGDGQTIYHCPFCGSGQVIARSDKTVECEFCHTAFTVQVQPEYPSFPQTINGMPVDVPGMPGQIGEESGMDPGMDPGMETDEEGNPLDPGEDDGSEVPPGEEGDEDGSEGPPGGGGSFSGKPGPSNQPPWLKGSSKAARIYRNLWGVPLSEDAYVKHLALAHADDSQRVLAVIRADNEHSG